MVQMMPWGTGHREERGLSQRPPAPTSPLSIVQEAAPRPTHQASSSAALRATISSPAEAQVMTLSHFPGLLVTPVSQGNLGGMKGHLEGCSPKAGWGLVGRGRGSGCAWG